MRLFKLYWALEKLIDPGVTSSQEQYAKVLRELAVRADWLDLGCGHAILPDWIAGQQDLINSAKSVTGSDYDWKSIVKHSQITRLAAADISYLPFPANTFDLVSANMVVEHLDNPDAALKEIYRVLRPGGRFLFHTPNFNHYYTRIASWVPQRAKNKIIHMAEGRHEDDVFPTRYRLNQKHTIEHHARAAGFHIVDYRMVNTSSSGNIITLGPFVVLDLFVRRLTRMKSLQRFCSNFIVTLQKPSV